MISYSAALDLIESAATPLPARPAALADTFACSAAAEIRSAVAVPSFANAAMDGFALRSAETANATAAEPVRLTVAGSVAAGQRPPGATPANSAWEIMTGAPMPAQCDAVIAVERAESQAGSPQAILLREPVRPGQNRRLSGEDFQVGDLMLAAGELLSPQAIMALAAVGHDHVPTRPQPRIAVIITGSELVGSGLPDAAGRIRDVNGPYLAAALAALHLPLVAQRSVGDDPAALRRELTALAGDCDIIITTGGVSAGRLDFVPATLAGLGARLYFHKVAIRPGKPLLCARLPSGPLLFGLPGNPMAVAVGLRFFVLPAVRALLGRGREIHLPARAESAVRARPAMTFFAKAAARLTPEAVLTVKLLAGQESFRIGPLLQANCWAIVAASTTDLSAGDIVQVAPLLPTDFPAVL